ncbi:MAG: hypothetical protein LBC83_00140 [Oscillospiraceae bacterium]|jgi:hypothetical protein|nr:hypothetical protein [Oscillospiraceae bacterium]
MLAKLLKHDFLQSGRLFIWQILGGVGIGLIVTVISMQKNIGKGLLLPAILLELLLVILPWIMIFLGLVFIVVHVQRSLFTERGYLLFSLPVSSESLLLSKFLTGAAWLTINFLVAFGLYAVAGRTFYNLMNNLSDDLRESIGANMEDMPQNPISTLFEELLPSPKSAAVIGAVLLAIILMIFLLLMMIVIFTMTVSNVRPFQEHVGLWGFLFLIANIAVAVVLTVQVAKVIRLTPFTMQLLGEAVTPNLTLGLVPLMMTAGLFFLTNWLLKRKISLK